MAKKSNKKQITNSQQEENKTLIAPEVEALFKRMLRIMSWIVGICFTLIITLPNFDFGLLDISIKIIFYIGVLTLLLFILIEMFGENVKINLSRSMRDKQPE